RRARLLSSRSPVGLREIIEMHIKHAKTVVATLCGLLLTTASALGADARKMSAECISPEAYKNISECPGGPAQFEGKKRKGTSFKSMPTPVEKKKRTDTKPGDVGALEKLIERDTRKGKMQQRVRSLLITEITGLERLYKSTPTKSPDKPQLTLRLAEAYAELEQAAIREKIAADIQIQDAKRK